MVCATLLPAHAKFRSSYQNAFFRIPHLSRKELLNSKCTLSKISVASFKWSSLAPGQIGKEDVERMTFNSFSVRKYRGSGSQKGLWVHQQILGGSD